MSSIPQQLLLQVVLIALNAFFAATEIAVISLNATKLRKLSEEGDKSAGILLKMVEEPSGFLSTIQIGITLAGFLGSAFAADNFADPLVDWIYNGLGFQVISQGVLNTLAVILITIILSYFTLILGELVPKRVAMQRPLEVARLSCRVVSATAKVMRPMVAFLSLSTNAVLKLLRLKTEAEEETVTEDEIRMMVDLGEEKGTIDADEKQWIQNVFEFDDISVREAMTHEPDVEAIALDASKEEVLGLIQETGLSRYPVYDKEPADIVGILNARDYLLNLTREQPKPMKELLRPAYFVPETIHADQLFKDMQTKKIHIAVVIDEYGEVAGVITIEDLLEEIVGNIYDEFDPAQPVEIERLEDNLWRVSGGVDIETLGEALDMEIPESEDYDTLGGMVYSCLHTIPKDGTVLDVDVNGLHIQVERIEDRRIEAALVSKILPPAPEEGDAADKEKEKEKE
ncbi:MAG TPA: HlyC/CorC family transporter [Candidatus Excrementavichristensenella intestinipullorum]|nr:HlyC/CorC family transporter [Candidatus Excrementavichristensenella intestinipullorum]